jgi:hypothetical protein
MSAAQAEPMTMDAEAGLRLQLAQGNVVLGSAMPVLRHLLGSDQHALFDDEVIARLRGILGDLARQLCQELDAANGRGDPRSDDDPAIADLADGLMAVPGLLGHLHAAVLEWQVAQRLQTRLGIDPVVSPLLQALIGSPEPETSAAAMQLLAAQARFVRHQLHMRLPLGELPGDLLHGVLLMLQTGEHLAAQAEAAVHAKSKVRAGYDESATRLGLSARLVTGMRGGALAALTLPHAGVTLFATALGLAARQDRDMCVFALQQGQAARLGLTLRAGGARLALVQDALLVLHPSGDTPVVLADEIAAVSPERAAALLAVEPAALAAG